MDERRTAYRTPLLTGMFRDRESAERAYDSLTERGYTRDDVTLMMSDEARRRYFGDGGDTELGSEAAEGAGVGAAVGAASGGIVGALIGAGIPEERAREYESGMREGGILMGVTPRSDEDAEHFERQWQAYRGEQIYRDRPRAA